MCVCVLDAYNPNHPPHHPNKAFFTYPPDAPNAFDFVDVNEWKDLAPKLMLMVGWCA